MRACNVFQLLNKNIFNGTLNLAYISWMIFKNLNCAIGFINTETYKYFRAFLRNFRKLIAKNTTISKIPINGTGFKKKIIVMIYRYLL